MFHRVFNTLRNLNYRNHPGTGFDSYLSSIQRHNMDGGPRVEEARKDFRNRVHNETHGLLG